MTSTSASSAAAHARTAYETLEPLHLTAYFNPYLRDAAHQLGIGEMSLYAGGRAGPLGPVPAQVVTATFYNFRPERIAHCWDQALGAGLSSVLQAREHTVDRSLREALGPLLDSPELPALVTQLQTVTQAPSYVGRPLAAAWAALPWPQAPHLALWHAATVLREYRGDGHIAALVLAGLSPVQSLVLHEAPHPDPALRRRTMGKKLLLITRGWDQDHWQTATSELRERGLLDDDGAMTADGAQLYDRIEAQTDEAAAPAWSTTPDAADLLRRVRPFVKAVIDAGFLPGTGR